MFSLLTRTHARKKTRSALRSTNTDFFFRTHTTTTQNIHKTGMVGIRVRFSRHVTALSALLGAVAPNVLNKATTHYIATGLFFLFGARSIYEQTIGYDANAESELEEVEKALSKKSSTLQRPIADEAKLDENERRCSGEDDDEDYYAARRRRRSKHPLRRLLPNLPPSISHDVPRRVGRPVSNRHHRVSRGLRSSRRHDRRRVRPRGVHVRRRPRRQTNGRGNQRENGWVVRGSFIRSLWCPRVDSRGIILLLCICRVCIQYYYCTTVSILLPFFSSSFVFFFQIFFIQIFSST